MTEKTKTTRSATAPTPETTEPTSKKTSGSHTKPTQPERMLEMLRRLEGVSLDELVAALDIQPHSARALISVHARKKHGLKVKATDGRYHIVPDG